LKLLSVLKLIVTGNFVTINGNGNATIAQVNYREGSIPPPPTILGPDTVITGRNNVLYIAHPNDKLTSTWSYTGTGVNYKNADSLKIDFLASATSGTLSVAQTNLCGTSTPAFKQIVVKYAPGNCPTNTWTGNISSNWNEAGNWSCGSVPAEGGNVSIPVTVNRPMLTSPVTVGNLHIENVLQLNDQRFTIDGTISGSGAVTGSTNATVVINGNAGSLKFTEGAAILRSLILNSASVHVDENLVIIGQ
jgi:hypothetical protein